DNPNVYYAKGHHFKTNEIIPIRKGLRRNRKKKGTPSEMRILWVFKPLGMGMSKNEWKGTILRD
ncbi:hypothetical protein ADUPG1_004285, partial [Aduncisulcus paluster]